MGKKHKSTKTDFDKWSCWKESHRKHNGLGDERTLTLSERRKCPEWSVSHLQEIHPLIFGGSGDWPWRELRSSDQFRKRTQNGRGMRGHLKKEYERTYSRKCQTLGGFGLWPLETPEWTVSPQRVFFGSWRLSVELSHIYEPSWVFLRVREHWIKRFLETGRNVRWQKAKRGEQ